MKHLVVLTLALLVVEPASAQHIGPPKIFGLRINGSVKDRFPVAGLNVDTVTIEFDLDASQPQDFRVKFYHCEENWEVTKNQFINDELKNSTKFPIPFEHAPAGVEHYTYHYTLRVPGFPGIEQFAYSGNYTFEIWDRDQTILLDKGRFFVAENRIPIKMIVGNRYLPSVGLPLNQVNKIEALITVPGNDSFDPDKLLPSQIQTMDIYKNRELASPNLIDVNDDNPNTFVEGFDTPTMTFIVDNVQPGNEYRCLDLTNVDYYPPDRLSRNHEGEDIGRMFHQAPPDHDGESAILTDSRYADYLQYRFELGRETDDIAPVYVVGDFNGWIPADEWKLRYDATTQRYVLETNLRRGQYDYQYVCNGNDWRSVEGNDWRTVNVYTALLYYHDTRFGGFDRIVGLAQQTSPGGIQPTTK